MRASVSIEGLSTVLDTELRVVARNLTRAMGDATVGLKEDLRGQVRDAGLGNRLANTWQGRTYPQTVASLEPAGYVWSKAPHIIAAFAAGATIYPALMNFLAIPTENVPKKVGSRGKKSMSPRDVERSFEQSLIIRRGKRGSYLGFVDVVRSRNGRGWRRATRGRVAQGRKSELVLMFIFVPRVRLPKLLDIHSAAERWGARVPALFNQRMGMIG